MTTPDLNAGPQADQAADIAVPQAQPEAQAAAPVADDALSAAGRALDAVENLPLERHPEAFAHFDELLRAALEAPGHVLSG
jgi:hypothetical protein